MAGVAPGNAAVATMLVDALLNWDPAVRAPAARTLNRLGAAKLARSPEVLHMLELARQYGPADVQWVVNGIQSVQ
jgi:hypothetical protein